MALDFPTSPTVGQKYPAPSVVGVPTYTWDGEKWTTRSDAIAGDTYVKKTGDKMTGTLNVNDAWIGLGGGGGSGVWSFKGDPTVDANTRWGLVMGDDANLSGFTITRYNETGVSIDNPIGISRSDGLVYVVGNPIAPLGIATKQYVDAGGARVQRFALGGLTQQDVQVPTWAVGARLTIALYQPTATTQNPLIQLSVAPGVFRNTVGEYVLGGFYHLAAATPTNVTPLNSVSTLPGMTMSGGADNVGLPAIIDGILLLARANTTTPVFVGEFRGSSYSAGAAYGHTFYNNYLTNAASGSALRVLAFRLISNPTTNWVAESYLNVEWF